MLTRIRLRRTASSLNSLSNNENENHHLRYGEALYSTGDHALVIGGSDTTRTISQIQNRFFAIPPQKGNLVYASAASPASSSATSYPTFRKLVPNDLPSGIPASKITGIQTYSNGAGISISDAGVISNAGVRSVTTGPTDGTIKVNTNGTISNVAVKGLGSAAYQPTTAFQAPLKTLTFNNSGSGSASTANYNGNAAMIISYNTVGAAPSSHTHNYAGSSTAGGAATSAVKLATKRTFKVNLASTSASSGFDGTANISDIGVSGKLSVANGGTGVSTFTNKNSVIVANASTGNGILSSIQSKSGAFYSTGTDSKPQFATLPVAQGGTGKTSWTANQLVYATASNTLGQLTPAQSDYVLMSDENKKPAWSDPSSLLVSALDRFKIWERLDLDTHYLDPELNDLDSSIKFLTLGTITGVSSQLQTDFSNVNSVITVFDTIEQISKNKLRLSGNKQNITFAKTGSNFLPSSRERISYHRVSYSIKPHGYFVLQNVSSDTFTVDFSLVGYPTIYYNDSDQQANFYGWEEYRMNTSLTYFISKNHSSSTLSPVSGQSGWYYYGNDPDGLPESIKTVSLALDWVSNSEWKTLFNPTQTLTHGINSNNSYIQLYRGTLADQLYKRKKFSYTGTGEYPNEYSDGYYAEIILDIFGNFGYIPKNIIISKGTYLNEPTSLQYINHDDYYALISPTYGQSSTLEYEHPGQGTSTAYAKQNICKINTENLYVGCYDEPSPTTPVSSNPISRRTKVPLFSPSGTGGCGVRWTDKTCKKIAIYTRKFIYGMDNEAKLLDSFNEAGVKYIVSAMDQQFEDYGDFR